MKTVHLRHNDALGVITHFTQDNRHDILRIRTSDAADALLTTNTPAQRAANERRVHELTGYDPGRVWDGYQKAPDPQAYLDSLPREARDRLLQDLQTRALRSDSGNESPKATVTTDRGATFDAASYRRKPWNQFSKAVSPADINKANAEHYAAQRGGR